MSTSRIALVLNAPGLGGVTEVVYHLLRHLPRDEFTPSLFFLKNDRHRQDRLDRFAELGIEIGWARPGGGKIGAVADLAEWLSEHRIDLVHTHSYRPNLYGRLAGLLCRPNGMGMIAHYHNHYDDKWDADPAALPIERRLVASTDAMIAVSRSVRDHVSGVLALDPDVIEVVHNGVDADQFTGIDRVAARAALQIADDALVIGLVGRICRQKGQDDLVEAATLLVPRFPRARFILVGDLEDRALHARLVERIAAAGLEETVRFAGFRTDMPEIYAALDILAAPSRWEGFPLTLLEAMAAGLPIVASRIPPIEEAVGRSGAALLVPPDSPIALADALASLAANSAQRAAASLRGRSAARSHSWQTAAQRTADIYQRVLERTRRPVGCG